MQVFIVVTPMGHILGVYATAEAAHKICDAIGEDCRITTEFVQN